MYRLQKLIDEHHMFGFQEEKQRDGREKYEKGGNKKEKRKRKIVESQMKKELKRRKKLNKYELSVNGR